MGRYKIQLMCDEFAEEKLKQHKHKLINEQVEILKDTLEEMMTGFDTEDNRIDFILDICNGYKKRIENDKSKP